jgi:hypothetical protein
MKIAFFYFLQYFTIFNPFLPCFDALFRQITDSFPTVDFYYSINHFLLALLQKAGRLKA